MNQWPSHFVAMGAYTEAFMREAWFRVDNSGQKAGTSNWKDSWYISLVLGLRGRAILMIQLPGFCAKP